MRFARVGTLITESQPAELQPAELQTSELQTSELQPADWDESTPALSPQRRATVGGALVLTGWLLITVSNTASIGHLNPRPIPCLLLAAVILIIAVTRGGGAPLRLAPGTAAVFALIAGSIVMFVPMFTYLPAGDFGWLRLAMAMSAG